MQTTQGFEPGDELIFGNRLIAEHYLVRPVMVGGNDGEPAIPGVLVNVTVIVIDPESTEPLSAAPRKQVEMIMEEAGALEFNRALATSLGELRELRRRKK